MQRILQLPLFVLFMGLGSLAMYVPALTAGAVRDYETARPFLYGGTLFLILAICVGLAVGFLPLQTFEIVWFYRRTQRLRLVGAEPQDGAGIE